MCKDETILKTSDSCCANCNYFNYDSPRFDQPYPEFWCGKNHWCGISSTEEYDDLNKPFKCIDFIIRKTK